VSQTSMQVRAADGEPHTIVDGATDAVLRGCLALGLTGIALIHLLDVFSKFKETPYLGWADLALIAACLAIGSRIVHRGGARWCLLAGLVAGATMVGYVLSRTTGLPGSGTDIGNWAEPLGVAALFVESVVLALSVYAYGLGRVHRS